jgi:hypothetical protein
MDGHGSDVAVTICWPPIGAVWLRKNKHQQTRGSVVGPERVYVDASGWDVGAEDRAALASIGLPARVEPFFEARIQTADAPRIRRRHGLAALYAIGWDLGRDLGIAPNGDGVFAVDPLGELPDCFVNSSVADLVAFLDAVVEARRRFVGLDVVQAERIVAETRVRLASQDPRAFSTANTWWSLVFEQLEIGMY